jgi:hypothetical protein
VRRLTGYLIELVLVLARVETAAVILIAIALALRHAP